MLEEVAGNEVSWAERSSAGHYPWRWAAPGAEEQTLGNVLQHAPWSYRALWWVAVITDGIGVWGVDGPKPKCFLPKAASERGLCNGWTLVGHVNCNSEKECSSSLAVIYNYWYWEHQGNRRLYGNGFLPAFWQQEHLLFERKAGSESLVSVVVLGQGLLVSRITVIYCFTQCGKTTKGTRRGVAKQLALFLIFGQYSAPYVLL